MGEPEFINTILDGRSHTLERTCLLRHQGDTSIIGHEHNRCYRIYY
jgi:hypothetical protein